MKLLNKLVFAAAADEARRVITTADLRLLRPFVSDVPTCIAGV